MKDLVPTHAGDDSDGKIWGVEGMNILFILAGLLLSIGLAMMALSFASARLCLGRGGDAIYSGGSLRLHLETGRPKSFDTDLLEILLAGSGWMPASFQPPQPDFRLMKAPNGWISQDLMIWNELDRRGFVSKGFVLDVPDLRHAGEQALNSFYQSVRQFLHTLDEGTRAQLRWSVDSDYRDELLAYHALTEERCAPDSWSAMSRNERFNRYWQAMQEGRLRREKLVLFLSKRVTTSPLASADRNLLADHYRRTLSQFNEAFGQHGAALASIFEPHGCRVTPMSTEDLFRYCAAFFNPSYLRRDNYDPIGQFREEETIQQNCWHQGVQGGKAFGFFSDGFYHNLVILKRRPQRTRRGIFWGLTSLPFLDYAITVNLYPQNIRKEITRAERSLERVRGDYAAEGKHSLLTSKEVKEQRIRHLAQGDVVPIHYDYVVHVWDATEDGLISKTRQIETAFSQMEDAQCWTSNISSAATTKNIWFQTWPGWLWGKYTHHADNGLDEWLADLLPLSSTFTGHLKDAEALYDGSNHNLIGVRNFLSSTPQLAVLLGMTRAGKSAIMCDLLSQTDPYYDFTLIVEEGLSYGIWTQAQGAMPIVVQPDGDLTLNYLDTLSGPLTNLQITTVAALIAKMAGHPADEDRRSLRLAQITQYVEQLYTDRFEEWVAADATRLETVDVFGNFQCILHVFNRPHRTAHWHRAVSRIAYVLSNDRGLNEPEELLYAIDHGNIESERLNNSISRRFCVPGNGLLGSCPSL